MKKLKLNELRNLINDVMNESNTLRDAAGKLIDAAEAYYEGGMSSFEGEKEMEEMYLADKRGLRLVADLISTGDIDKAYRVASRLDTNVREVIPDDVWEMLGGSLIKHRDRM